MNARRLRIESLFSLLAVCAFCVLAPAANAATATYYVDLVGTDEVPPNGSAATGRATVFIDTIADLLSVELSWTGLSGPATAGHIHCCVPPGVPGPVVVPFVSLPAATSGTYNVIVLQVPQSIFDGIINGQAYINIHTAQFPGGEIRGQLLPEPAAWLMMIAGFGFLAAVRRNKFGQPSHATGIQ